jgi:nitrilase
MGPAGTTIAGPLERPEEEILYGEVDLESIIPFKYALDYAGHYNRPELFAHHFKQYFN